ncbi:MAG: NAD-dependent dehydratase [Nitrospirae bacterium GWD2_57_9]|nr:MAG: NAD-dependent dehydratase [Nitrospirae bacterium GWD2_57_9]
MKVLVTGATGFIGFHVARHLQRNGFEVRALVRNAVDAAFLEDLGLEPVAGDIREINSLYSAMRGCRQVYHLAADYRLWVPDPAAMYEINVQGTRNVMHAALMLNLEKVVYTSTVGVLAPARSGRPSSEETPSTIKQMVGHYKASKFIAEREVEGFVKKGLPVVIVNPSTPIGAMDRKPTPTGQIIVDFLNDRIPAFLDTGLNLVDVEDIAAGHLLAAQRGRVGQRYILGNRNVSLSGFFGLLAEATGKQAPTVRLPYLPVLLAAHIDTGISKLIPGRRPRIPLAGVQMARHYMHFDSSRAVRELDLPQTPVEGAIRKAVQWFQANGYVHVRQHAYQR